MVHAEKIRRILRKPFHPNFFTSLVLVAVFLMAGFLLVDGPSENFKAEEIREVRIAGQIIKVELALNDEEKSKGLSGRGGLAEGKGMLFVFEQPGRYSFWMKDMNFPIDIIWITEGMKVAHIKKNALPERYPESYMPEEDAKYVLEVSAGFSDKYGFRVGDSVHFAD